MYWALSWQRRTFVLLEYRQFFFGIVWHNFHPVVTWAAATFWCSKGGAGESHVVIHVVRLWCLGLDWCLWSSWRAARELSHWGSHRFSSTLAAIPLFVFPAVFDLKSNCFSAAKKISTINKKKKKKAADSTCRPSHPGRGFHSVDDDTHVQRPYKSVRRNVHDTPILTLFSMTVPLRGRESCCWLDGWGKLWLHNSTTTFTSKDLLYQTKKNQSNTGRVAYD